METTQTTRRDFLKKTGAAFLSAPLLATLASLRANAASSGRQAPNLVYVFADQVRFCARGAFEGGDPVLTPRLDRFAREGLELAQACSTYPLCSPHRAMLLSGRYPNRNSVIGNINSAANRPYQLQDNQVCLTDVLANAGYDVGYIGKWHLTKPHEPLLQEFRRGDLVWNEFTSPESRHGISYWYANNCVDRHLHPCYWGPGAGRSQHHTVDQWSPEHETDKAIEYLEKIRRPGVPFALFLSHNPPHPPFKEVPEKYRKLYAGATPAELLKRPNVSLQGGKPIAGALQSVVDYFAAISGVDEQFGRLLDAITRLGLEEDTLVVFTSDHGEMMGSQERMNKNIWYEEAFRIPFLLRFPGRLPANRKDDLLIGTPDIPATLLGLLGLSPKLPGEWQGTDYARTLTGESTSRPEGQLYWGGNRSIRGIRTERYTCVVSNNADQPDFPHLYDNREDPFQMHNQAGEKPALVKELSAKIHEFCRRIDDRWRPVSIV